jgi:hypothetical protein
MGRLGRKSLSFLHGEIREKIPFILTWGDYGWMEEKLYVGKKNIQGNV